MRSSWVYSLKLERWQAELNQSVIRILLAATTSLVLIKYYGGQEDSRYDVTGLSLPTLASLVFVFMTYSVAMWVMVKYRPQSLKPTVAVSSMLEVVFITYLIRATAGSGIPFHLWYIFYVVSVATRYGWQYSILALSASIVSFTTVLCNAPESVTVNLPAVLGFTGFLLVLAFMFGQISEKQLSYQSSLSIVNEFRAELAGLANSKDILNHMLVRTKDLLNTDTVFFLPARRGADASEAPGLRSQGADPVLMGVFRESGGAWNVEEILKEQRPIFTNKPGKDQTFAEGMAARLGLRNIAAAPMMVRSVPVGVVYAVNRRDHALASSDLHMLELIATQAAPVVENALLWERLREAASEEERLRIARDLHDNFLQTLAAIKLHLERCKILVDKDPTRAIAGIERIHQIATRGLAEVRSYLSELRLMGPEPSRFREAIARCAADAEVKGGFVADVSIDNLEDAMAPNVALAAFQIMRELLNNVAAHSEAKHVKIIVSTEEGRLLLEVIDDGIGFNVPKERAEKASAGHMGLVGIEERARQADGSLTIISEPGQGTRVIAVLNLK